MRENFLPLLRATDDRIAALPGLEGWEVWAGDGHAMAHATHDTRNGEGAHRSVKAIYRIDLRTGWAGFLDLQQPTDKDSEHEITTLKRLDRETLRCGAPKGVRVLWVYDSATVDFRFGYNLKCSKGIYTLTDWKANLRPMNVIPLPFEREHPLNALVVADETGKRVQAMAICIACNLLRIFHDKLRREEGIEDTKVAKAWNQRLAARVTKAAELGRSFPESLYRSLYRPTEVSLQFLRWLRYGLARATCYRQALARLRPLMEKYL